MIDMIKNTNDLFKSLIVVACEETGLELTRGFEIFGLAFAWSLTPWLGLYGIINLITRVMTGRY